MSLLALVTLAGWGCKSTGGSSHGDAAWVEVRGRSADDIREATADVFRKAGWLATSATASELVFDRQGSTMSTVLYGGWMDGPVWYRAKVTLTERSGEVWLLRCRGFRLEDRGDSFFERAKELRSRKPYQELLDQVKAQLGQ